MYEKIDGFIFEAVRSGCKSFADIEKTEAGYEAGKIAERTGRLPMRVIDARLQAMRKKKRISYGPTGWVVHE